MLKAETIDQEVSRATVEKYSTMLFLVLIPT